MRAQSYNRGQAVVRGAWVSDEGDFGRALYIAVSPTHLLTLKQLTLDTNRPSMRLCLVRSPK